MYEDRHRKEHILLKLKRLLPGSTAVLKAVRTRSGLTHEPSEVADALKDHWGYKLQKREVDLTVFRAWLAGDGLSFRDVCVDTIT